MATKKFLLILIALGLAACAAPTPPGPIWFQFWFALTGAPGEATIEIAQRFNAAQTRCVVELAPQDSLNDGFNKIKIGLRSKELPTLVQVSNLATQALIDLQAVEPMQDFIDR
ncbi:MAG: hypothetical protein L0Y55_14695, partial [Anaerolineales bacterium]|nr:hypothetical protein [Anaerolineales bacterium]